MTLGKLNYIISLSLPVQNGNKNNYFTSQDFCED